MLGSKGCVALISVARAAASAAPSAKVSAYVRGNVDAHQPRGGQVHARRADRSADLRPVHEEREQAGDDERQAERAEFRDRDDRVADLDALPGIRRARRSGCPPSTCRARDS